MCSYNQNSMMKANHVIQIGQALEALGSKMPSTCYDGMGHSLSNILHLACGSGTYGLTKEQVMSLNFDDFELNLVRVEFSRT